MQQNQHLEDVQFVKDWKNHHILSIGDFGEIKELSERRSWGTENYRPDMDFSQCKQSEPNDEYGTVEEIYNAMRYYDLHVLNYKYNSILLLKDIQKGLSDEKLKQLGDGLSKLDDNNGMIKIGTPQNIANKVHNSLDWLRATDKRKWDTRGLNPCRQMLDYCKSGTYLNSATFLHYDEDSER